MHRLTEADREVQAAARTFADELIPFEVEAEMAGGELAPRSPSDSGPGPASSA